MENRENTRWIQMLEYPLAYLIGYTVEWSWNMPAKRDYLVKSSDLDRTWIERLRNTLLWLSIRQEWTSISIRVLPYFLCKICTTSNVLSFDNIMPNLKDWYWTLVSNIIIHHRWQKDLQSRLHYSLFRLLMSFKLWWF